MNLIEWLWDHLKRTLLAKVLFVTSDDLVAVFRCSVDCVNGHRKKMGLMFNHDDVNKKLHDTLLQEIIIMYTQT